MLLDPPEMLGLVAGFFGSFALAPQAVKIIKSGQARDVSAVTYVMTLSAALMWASYGLWRSAPSIVFWNAVAAAFAISVLVLKWRSDRS
jgi:MtN3 and saliva related transmembrane protein